MTIDAGRGQHCVEWPWSLLRTGIYELSGSGGSDHIGSIPLHRGSFPISRQTITRCSTVARTNFPHAERLWFLILQRIRHRSVPHDLAPRIICYASCVSAREPTTRFFPHVELAHGRILHSGSAHATNRRCVPLTHAMQRHVDWERRHKNYPEKRSQSQFRSPTL
jgi:hypothetical protein